MTTTTIYLLVATRRVAHRGDRPQVLHSSAVPEHVLDALKGIVSEPNGVGLANGKLVFPMSLRRPLHESLDWTYWLVSSDPEEK